MRRIITLVCLFALSIGPVAAQETDPAASPATEAAAPSVDAAPAAGQGAPTAGLPQTAPPPRTLRAYWHLFGAYAIVWTLLFGYVIYLGRRSGALEREVARLEGSGS